MSCCQQPSFGVSKLGEVLQTHSLGMLLSGADLS